MSSIRLSNESQIDMYVGDHVFRNVEIIREDTVQEDSGVMVEEQSFVARGISRNGNYFAPSLIDTAHEEAIWELKNSIYRGMGIPPDLLEKPFKSVNMKPKNNKAAKCLLSKNPETL